MVILSLLPLSSLEILQVKQIFRESRCPNESLSSTFERYSGFVEGKIFFDNAQNIWADIAERFANKNFDQLIKELDASEQIIITVI